MARRRRRRPRRPTPRQKEPRSAQFRYIAALRRVWYEVEQTALYGLRPLLEIWPAEEPRADAVREQNPFERRLGAMPRQRTAPFIARSMYPAGDRRRPRQYVNPGPFGPPLRRRIHDLTDADLRRLWPQLDPQDVRAYAPWATSREEVYRIAFPAGTPIREGESALFDLQDRVRQAIQAERVAMLSRRPRPDPMAPIEIVPATRPPGAFRVLHPVYDQAGRIMLPPRPDVISAAVIRRQIEWIDLATHQLVTATNLGPILDERARQTELFASKQMERVLGIDLRGRDAGLQPLINAWREANINLIESGTMAHAASPRLRPSMLADLSSIVEDAHARGIRVEALAGQIADRFGVSDKRAELIARDQILKLNAQVTRHRQEQAGVREYRWSSSRDERTREMHRELDGSTQSWANPPEVAPGRHEHPGGDYQCRCVAVPIPPRDGGEFDYGL